MCRQNMRERPMKHDTDLPPMEPVFETVTERERQARMNRAIVTVTIAAHIAIAIALLLHWSAS